LQLRWLELCEDGAQQCHERVVTVQATIPVMGEDVANRYEPRWWSTHRVTWLIAGLALAFLESAVWIADRIDPTVSLFADRVRFLAHGTPHHVGVLSVLAGLVVHQVVRGYRVEVSLSTALEVARMERIPRLWESMKSLSTDAGPGREIDVSTVFLEAARQMDGKTEEALCASCARSLEIDQQWFAVGWSLMRIHFDSQRLWKTYRLASDPPGTQRFRLRREGRALADYALCLRTSLRKRVGWFSLGD
jgi:hypothetical protein